MAHGHAQHGFVTAASPTAHGRDAGRTATHDAPRPLAAARKARFREFAESDWEAVVELHTEAFRAPPDMSDWLNGGRVLETKGHIRAGLCLGAGGQFFGGRSVPVVRLSAVVVAPELRGQGVGRQLVSSALAEIGGTDVAATSLFPTSVGFYRSLGFEIAGTHTRYATDIRKLSLASCANVVRWTDADLPDVIDCYRRFAERAAGLLDRDPPWWHASVLSSPDGLPVYRYAVRRGAQVVAYLIYTQESIPSSLAAYSVVCRDFVWHDRQGAQALLAFVAQQRSLGDQLAWCGAADDPLVFFFDQQQISRLQHLVWMMKIVDVRRALESRSYPPDVECVVDFSVCDRSSRPAPKSFRAEVASGVANVTITPMRDGTTLSAGTLAAIYTGCLHPHDGVRLGLIDGATSHQIENLAALFAGPRPWLMDRF